MDFTRTATFLTCPEKYRLLFNVDGHGHGLKRVEGEEALPLVFGSALHAGLATHYQQADAATVGKAFLVAYPTAPEGEMVRTPANGLLTLTHYRNYWANVDREFKVLEVESLHTFDIGAEEPWEVKYDLILEHPQNGILALETKHTAKPKGFTDEYWRGFEPNSQVTGQFAGLVDKYGQCSGILVNGIWIGYNERAGKRHPQGFWCEFQRQYFHRTQAQIEDWKVRMSRTIARMRRTTAWEKNESQCTYCFGRELCLSAGDEQVQAALYELVENPLAYLEKGVERR